ncbi:ROK family protein [Glaciibacter flavus]|uniref:ROK family protein n=1 Tax=Orlajensenia flava TaxID=2565934 RepID=UPI003AFF9C32
MHRQLDHLAVALRNAIDLLNPQLVVLGGFLASIHSADPDYLEQRVARQTLDAPWRNTRITAAELGGDLLMIGAAELAFEPLLADPGAFSAWEQARRA